MADVRLTLNRAFSQFLPSRRSDMKSKLTTLLFAVVLLFAVGTCPVAAQKPAGKTPKAPHPLEGTWKLNAAQSKIAPNQADAPKEVTMVFRVVGDQFEFTETGTQIDGKAIAGKYTLYLNGGVFKALQPAPAEGESSVETMFEPGNRFLTTLKNGRQIEVQHLVIGKDGKTMSITAKGTDAKGKPFESVLVYDKQ
jgi:hypothetical protein